MKHKKYWLIKTLTLSGDNEAMVDLYEGILDEELDKTNRRFLAAMKRPSKIGNGTITIDRDTKS